MLTTTRPTDHGIQGRRKLARILPVTVIAMLLASCAGAPPRSGSPDSVAPGSREPAVPPLVPAVSMSASASARALSGTIAFGRADGPDHWQVWRACADLSKSQQLT